MSLMQRIATFYCRNVSEVMREAGFHFDMDPEAGAQLDLVDAQFRRLVLDPALRPVRMNPAAVDFIPDLVKRQWLDFAQRLEAMLKADGGLSVAGLLDGKPPVEPEP